MEPIFRTIGDPCVLAIVNIGRHRRLRYISETRDSYGANFFRSFCSIGASCSIGNSIQAP